MKEMPPPWSRDGHVGRIGWLEMAGANQRNTRAHLLLHRGEVLWCQHSGLGELDLSPSANTPSITQQ